MLARLHHDTRLAGGETDGGVLDVWEASRGFKTLDRLQDPAGRGRFGHLDSIGRPKGIDVRIDECILRLCGVVQNKTGDRKVRRVVNKRSDGRVVAAVRYSAFPDRDLYGRCRDRDRDLERRWGRSGW